MGEETGLLLDVPDLDCSVLGAAQEDVLSRLMELQGGDGACVAVLAPELEVRLHGVGVVEVPEFDHGVHQTHDGDVGPLGDVVLDLRKVCLKPLQADGKGAEDQIVVHEEILALFLENVNFES